MPPALARSKLPLPLEAVVGRALAQRERAARHEGLVVAWELAVRMLGGTLWTACRHLGADSPKLRKAATALARPTFGHWVGLTLAAAEVLRERRDPLVVPLRRTLEGLEERVGSEGGLSRLRERILEIAPPGTRISSVHALLDQMVFYRNKAQSTHQQVEADFRDASLEALRDGLLEFCERVPPCGEFALVFVGKLERAGQSGLVEIARLHGRDPVWDACLVPFAAWNELRSSRLYLLHEPALFVPLFPMAAVGTRGSEWQVGWYARCVQPPTVAYQGAAGVDFQVTLAPEDFAPLAARDPATEGAPASAAGIELDPWRGLLAYDEAHAPIFLGREEDTDAALARVAERGALFVYGASGSGKSSWLRAGILPALRARATLAGRSLLPIVCLPGSDPVRALQHALLLARGGSTKQALIWKRTVEEALHGAGASLAQGVIRLLRALVEEGLSPVLFVDQLEEAALGTDLRARDEFLETLAHAAATARSAGFVVLASVRADRLAPLLEHSGLRACLQDEGWALGSIPHERLGRVIREPPRQRGVRVEPGLAEMILADVGSEPGTLALLSQVLATLWSERARHGGVLTKQGYLDAGRVSGALELQAEAALAEAGAGAAPVERHVDRLFRALVASGEGGRMLRRRLELPTLASALGMEADALRGLAQPFVRRHLLVLSGSDGEETIEIAHERLLEGWPRLAKLLAGESEALELRNAIERSAQDWKRSGGKRELWSDSTSRLRRGEELFERGRIDLDEVGRAFLVASRAAVERRKRMEQAALGVFGLLLALAIGFAWLAWNAREKAHRQELEAESAKEQRTQFERYASQLREMAMSLTLLRELGEQADALWPATPARIPDYEQWMSQADRLLNVRSDWPGLPGFEAELTKLKARAQTPARVDTAEWWQVNELERLVAGLRGLVRPEDGLATMGTSPQHGWGIPRRLELARGLLGVAQSQSARQAWDEVEKVLATDSAYQGVRLARRVDLLPIGRDRESKLLEFAHLPSGLPAHRNGNGRLDLEEDTGIVLVLLPGDDALLGAQSADPKAPNFDPLEAPKGAQHTHRERIPAFLVSKYEMTQSQWVRACGRNPSFFRPGTIKKEWNAASKDADLLHPVESVSWNECVQVLDRLGLRLPTEDEWEYSARGGKDAPWSTGPSPQSLQGSANLADRFGYEFNRQTWNDAYESSLDDHNAVHADVGSYAPNPYGLHDVHGNVWEWCDTLSRIDSTNQNEVVRGGGWDSPARDARASWREIQAKSSTADTVGLRPVCSL